MVRHVAAIVLAVALLMLGGCQAKISDEKANAVLETLAVELATMEGTSTELKMDKVKVACEKNGVELNAFAIYLDATPGADQKLSDLLARALRESIENKKKKFQAELKQVEENARTAAAGGKQELEKKKTELQEKADEEMEKMAADFDKKKKELQDAIQKARIQP
jgi:hypothetical protein